MSYAHDPLMVVLSVAVAFMAGFTGLSLTRGANALPFARRKLVVAMAAVALGGGIWSMHFVAMLGMGLPQDFYFDALITLISALAAILITGVALLLLHFAPRTNGRIALAGGIVGLGIAIMHYTGMSGLRIFEPVYTVGGVMVAAVASVLLSMAAVGVAYSHRGARDIMLGTVVFGIAVSAAHYIAMAGTTFTLSGAPDHGAIMSKDILAFGVTLSVFAISGAFLLSGVTFFPAEAAAEPAPVPVPAPAPAPASAPAASGSEPVATAAPEPIRLPFEKDGRTYFVDPAEVAAIRAEGRYTILYGLGQQRLFCPWSLTEAGQRLAPHGFIRAHRSYLVNPAHVASFERTRDSGVVHFAGLEALSKVPVSRSRLAEVREVLGV